MARARSARDHEGGGPLRIASPSTTIDLGSDALRGQLDDLGREVDAAIRSLRELARGLHPPILEQSGIAAALRAHTRDLPVLVSVDVDGVGRYDPAGESAAYFSCLEAVQNAVRHGGARRVEVTIDGDGAGLNFVVRDDGNGFDSDRVVYGAGLANIDDRISALGGQTRIETAPGAGTRVSGRIPARATSP